MQRYDDKVKCRRDDYQVDEVPLFSPGWRFFGACQGLTGVPRPEGHRCKYRVISWYSVPGLYGLDLKLKSFLSSNAFAYGAQHAGTYQHPNHLVPSNHQASGWTHRWCPNRRDV